MTKTDTNESGSRSLITQPGDLQTNRAVAGRVSAADAVFHLGFLADRLPTQAKRSLAGPGRNVDGRPGRRVDYQLLPEPGSDRAGDPALASDGLPHGDPVLSADRHAAQQAPLPVHGGPHLLLHLDGHHRARTQTRSEERRVG